MSANMDLVRSVFADWQRGEYRSIGWHILRSKTRSPADPHPAVGGTGGNGRRLERAAAACTTIIWSVECSRVDKVQTVRCRLRLLWSSWSSETADRPDSGFWPAEI